jgi:hypothetical protein
MRIVTLALAGIALLALCVPASALSLNLVDTEGPGDMVAALFGGNTGITVVGPVSFVDVTTLVSPPSGYVAQSAIYSGFSTVGIGPHPDGILLTTGRGNVPTTNTYENFSHLTPSTPAVPYPNTGGDGFLAALVGATINDVNILTFSFTVEPGVTSIEADFVFGTEEYPLYPNPADPDNSGYPDVFAFIVDGVNYALLPDGSIVSFSSTNGAYFNDNDGNQPGTSPYALEYDGITNSLRIVGMLGDGDVHTLKIAIGDAGDTNFDSGVFIGNLRVSGDQGNDGPVVPEPTSIALLGLGLAGLGLVVRKRRRTA